MLYLCRVINFCYTLWMMVIVTRIAAVSYLNTIPFIYGIEHEGNLRAELLLTPPSECAKNFIEGKADIALLPVAAVPSLVDAEVITDYCLGAIGPVRTVVIMSDSPIEEVKRLFMDVHSLTSVQLSGYLLKNKWKVEPEFYALEDYEQLNHAQTGDAFLLIGDKVFANEGRFAYSYDLAAEWIGKTKLPFAFAVWVARKGIDNSMVDALERALTFGIEHTWEAIVEYGFDKKEYNAYDYLTKNMDYLFDSQKHKALQKFWDSGMKISPRANPG